MTTPQQEPTAKVAAFNQQLAAMQVGSPKINGGRPKIDPARVSLDMMGQSSRGWFVRLPDGFIADDLKEPEAWSRCQASPSKALRKHDRIYVIAYDESWCADTIVASADETGAALAVFRTVSLPVRTRAPFQDDKYRIVWNGAGYHVERKSDNHKMTETVANEKLAERDLRNLYPQRVGA